jgi:hypothetical protein
MTPAELEARVHEVERYLVKAEIALVHLRVALSVAGYLPPKTEDEEAR